MFSLLLPILTYIHTFTTRSLDVDTLLYIGGVESHIPLISSLSPSRFGFEGCLANFTIDDRIVDLASPVHRYGTHEGCPPRDGSCDGERLWCPGNNGECVSVWNGSLCHCEEFPECDSSQSSSVSLSSGYVRLQLSHSVMVDNFTLAFRTRQTRGTLISFGSSASVKVKTREGVSEGGREEGGREGGRKGGRESDFSVDMYICCLCSQHTYSICNNLVACIELVFRADHSNRKSIRHYCTNNSFPWKWSTDSCTRYGSGHTTWKRACIYMSVNPHINSSGM